MADAQTAELEKLFMRNTTSDHLRETSFLTNQFVFNTGHPAGSRVAQ